MFMFLSVHHTKIPQRVIISYPINVMYNLIGIKFTTEIFLSNPPVHKLPWFRSYIIPSIGLNFLMLCEACASYTADNPNKREYQNNPKEKLKINIWNFDGSFLRLHFILSIFSWNLRTTDDRKDCSDCQNYNGNKKQLKIWFKFLHTYLSAQRASISWIFIGLECGKKAVQVFGLVWGRRNWLATYDKIRNGPDEELTFLWVRLMGLDLAKLAAKKRPTLLALAFDSKINKILKRSWLSRFWSYNNIHTTVLCAT